MKNISLRETQCGDYEVFYSGTYVGILDTIQETLTSSLLTEMDTHYYSTEHLEGICRLAHLRSNRFTGEFSNQDMYDVIN